MTDVETTTALPADVFGAARWMDELWNSTARAVSPELIEWQCNTWGSGAGRGDWTEYGTFALVAEAFGLTTSSNYDARDELIVMVPLEKFVDVATLIDRIGEDPEGWPWLGELDEEDDDENYRRQMVVAAEVLGRPVEDLVADMDLLETLRLE